MSEASLAHPREFSEIEYDAALVLPQDADRAEQVDEDDDYDDVCPIHMATMALNICPVHNLTNTFAIM